MSTIYQLKRRRMNNNNNNNNNNNTVKIDDIEDLLNEIFFRLPPISVLTFKSVSKRWYSLISNPQFLGMHSLRFHCNVKHRIDLLMPGLFLKPFSSLLPNYHSQFIHLFPQYQHFSRLDFLDATYSVLPRTEGSMFMLVDSCNGLLLYQTHSTTPTYFVCNPVTKQYIELPKLQQHKNLYYNGNPHLVFDPSASLSYKVVKFSLHRDNTSNLYCQLSVDFYSSVTGSWKPSKTINVGINAYNINHRIILLKGNDRTVLLNGVLYWNWRTVDEKNMFCFHVETDTMCYLPLPSKPTGYVRKLLYFGECCGHLLLIVRLTTRLDFRLTFPGSFDILEAKHIKLPLEQNLASDIWVVKYRVVNMFGFDSLTKQPSDVHILHYYKTGSKEIDEALLMNIDGRIFSYNLSCRAVGKELIIPNSQPFTEYTDVFPYIATLFPLR